MSEDTALIKLMEDVLHKIKLGFQLHNETVVKKALEEGENLLPRLTDKQAIGFLDSQLGNAYSDLFSLYEYKRVRKNIPLSETLQKAKTFFRNALVAVKDQNLHLEKQLWVNYGNCLDNLGRGVEALYAYDEALKIDPKFAMAIGNKAITSQHFASISGMYTSAIHIDAYHAIRSIIDDEELVAVGEPETKRHFEAVLQKIEAMFPDKKVLKESSIYFESIWVKDKKKDPSIREEILNAENMSLYALYDIFRDFQSGYYTQLKDIRRALTHRQLTVFELGSGESNNDAELVSITSSEMVNQTIQLMRLVKAAIIYLINTVTLEEKKKNMHSDKRLGRIEVDTTQFMPPQR